MYHVIEIQTNGSSSVIVTPIPVFSNKLEAESAYHQKMAYAAVSSCEIHSIVMLEDNGCVVMNGSYDHRNQPEPEA